MRLFFALLTSVSIFATSERTTASGQAPGTAEAYLQNLRAQGKERVIVKFADSIDLGLVRKYGHVKRTLKSVNAVVCEMESTKLADLESEAGIKFVLPDIVVPLPPTNRKLAPVERDYGGPVEVRWNNLAAGLNTQAAWNNYNVDGTGIKIAFLDTAVNYTLPDLAESYLGGTDFVDDDSDPITFDPNVYHGTEVASVGVGRGVSKIVGVAYRAGFYAVRTQNDQGDGYLGDLLGGIEWATAEPQRADVISMSLGHPGTGLAWNAGYGELIEEACNSAYNMGIVLVAGSGNDGVDYSYFPAGFANVVSVGAYREDQTIASFSNGGADVVAPGVDVYVIDPLNDLYLDSGTSLATPHVSAAAALVLQYARDNNIEIDNGYVYEALRHSAFDLGLDPVYQGKGKLWAAETFPLPPDPHDGFMDLLTGSWPLDVSVTFTDWAYQNQGIPVFLLGETMYQDLNLLNITDTMGGYADDIANLTITTRQTYYDRDGGVELPGDATEVFTGQSVAAGSQLVLPDSYPIPVEVVPGMNQTTVEFEFQWSGGSRLMQIGYNDGSALWIAATKGDQVPTAGQWALIVTALVVLTAATLVLSTRRMGHWTADRVR